MHIIIGIITALAGLFWALNSLQQSGFRLSSLNPFHWHRKNQWKKKYAQNPLYMLDNPMDAAAAVLLGIAKLEGEISREHKSEMLEIYSKEFNLDSDKAKDLFASTSYLLQSENNFLKNVDKVLSSSKEKFSSEQADSTLGLLIRIAKIESDISAEQYELIDSVTKILKPLATQQGKW
jgi:tellurite resistance protein